MADHHPIFLGSSSSNTQLKSFLFPTMASRHGLIAGATGTGKTVTLQTLMEGFSKLGVPVFAADVKGDLAGLACAGKPHPKVDERIKLLNHATFQQRAYPTVLWDLQGKSGHPIRTTVSEMGPLLFSRLLELSDTQSDALQLIFKIADDKGLLLIDMKDLKAVCSWMSEHTDEFEVDFGKIASSTYGSLLRKLVVLEDQLDHTFFGEPALEIHQLLRKDFSGNGLIHILDARLLIQQPRLYATFMLWLLSELFEDLDEVGELAVPRLVFFFDEAHLLFNEAPKPLLEKIEQVVRLVRSKGVGIYFITQNPIDLPETVLGQLGNRVQHALRAFTPRDQKAVRSAAETFRANPAFKVEEVITQLGVGEALVSVLDPTGTPTVVERIFIVPPESRIGAIDATERSAQMERSPYRGLYDQSVDRESAYEKLQKAQEQPNNSTPPPPLPQTPQSQSAGNDADLSDALGGGRRSSVPATAGPVPRERNPVGRPADGLGAILTKTVIRSVGSSIGSTVGRSVVRGILGSLMGGGRRR